MRQTHMDIREFGQQLIATGDLDPVYVALYGARVPEPQLCRLLLAYWCFYSLGLACWLSEHEGNDFWHKVRLAAVNDPDLPCPVGGRWPRASERRHFRGPKCVAVVDWLARDEPEVYVRRLATCGTDKRVMTQVQTWPMFGPWVAFKAADMMERVYGAHVRFDPNIGLMYDEPARALQLLNGGDPRQAYRDLLQHFAQYTAPGGSSRPCGPQEVETVLCKWKSQEHGHYHVGKDIREVRHALARWGETASACLRAAPREVS